MQHIPNNRITYDVRPSNLCVTAFVALGQKVWSPCSERIGGFVSMMS